MRRQNKLAEILYKEAVLSITSYLREREKLYHSKTARLLEAKSVGGLLVTGGSSAVEATRAAVSRLRDKYIEISCLAAASGDGDAEKRFVAEVDRARLEQNVVMLTEMDVLKDAYGICASVRLVETEGIGVIGVCGRKGVVESLRRAGRFDKVVRVAGGGLDGRKKVWAEIMKRLESDEIVERDAILDTLAESSPALDLLDFRRVCNKFLMRRSFKSSFEEKVSVVEDDGRNDKAQKSGISLSKESERGKMDASDLSTVLKEISLKRETSMYHTPATRAGPLYCNEKIFQFLHDYLLKSQNNRSALRRFNITAPKVVLLQGPSGVGKSHILRHLHHCLSPRPYNWMVIPPLALYSKWLGESEANLREVFATAKTLAPCILQFEELEEISRQRKEGGLEGRMVGVLLKELEDLDEDVVVIGCVRDMENLDGAVIRAGRVDKVVDFDVLTNKEVVSMLNALMARMGEPDQSWVLDVDVNIRKWTAGEVDRVGRNAFLLALREHREQRVKDIGVPMVVEKRHWLRALRMTCEEKY